MKLDYDRWFESTFKDRKPSYRLSQYPQVKRCWDHQQDKIDRLKIDKSRLLGIICELSKKIEVFNESM